ncbi:MAG: sodium:solute symporter family protein [Kiritimatiellia bacterium]|jgi:SSS family solute:Na+ symporter|nr:Na+:solute symporter [Lentisphaerota bacterium]HON47515.1 Na+:solute symporter [Kiritimatiellia bacterium]
MLTLSWLDAWIILGFLASVVLVGSWSARRAGQDTESFFLSGRNMPWWLLGVSMVACTFSCDTPNLITEIVRLNGVAGNWVWWAFLLTGMLTVFVYAGLWRRSGLDTDLGFYELRYSGRPAAFLRGFRAIYLGVVYNLIILGGVSLAAIKIGQIMFGLSPGMSLFFSMTGVAIYATLGGLTGSMWADFYQFAVAMTGAIFAAVYAVNSGMAEGGTTLAQLFAHSAVAPKLSMLQPSTHDFSTLMTVLILPLAVQWWNVWYPGAEPGGGGFVVQRMLSARNENHAIGGTLLFNVLHYAVRPWPWILVALASLVVFPLTPQAEQDAAQAWLTDHAAEVRQYDTDKAAMPPELREDVRLHRADARGVGSLARAFPRVDDTYLGHDIAYPGMVARMPRGWQGLIVASLIAAYMSTVATLLNWGSSYVVQDVYLRFLRPQASARHAVLVGRVTMLVMLLASAVIAFHMTTVKTIFHVLLQVGAGTGLLYILRWFWWRINVWSEVTAMVVSFIVAVFFQFCAEPLGIEAALSNAGWLKIMDFTSWKMVLGIIITTIAWVTVTYLTPPVEERTLVEFCRKIRPGGPGWRRFETVPEGAEPEGWNVPNGILCMMLGCLLVWASLFGTGYLLYGQFARGAVLLAVAAVAGGGLLLRIRAAVRA